VRALAATKHAPKAPPLALVFTDVESSTRLWEAYGSDMAAAMETHHDVIRRCIDQHQCYEVKTIGDAFMIACPTVLDAAMLCFDIQTSLHAAEWPATLVDWKSSEEHHHHGCVPFEAFKATSGAEDTGPVLQLDFTSKPKDTGFRGLNVRMGIHHCVEVEPKFDVIHRRYDYYGHDVNMSARVQGAAQGGQILVTEETLSALQNDPDFESVLGADCVAKHVSRAFELKGVAEPVSMYSVLPASIAHRAFPAMENAPEEQQYDRDDDAKMHSCSSIGSVAVSNMGGPGGARKGASQTVHNAVHAVFAELETVKPAAAETAVTALCKRYKLPAKGTLAKRTRRLVSAMSKAIQHDEGILASASPTPQAARSHLMVFNGIVDGPV
jgi:class 3 adenylate cyclase